MSIIKIGFIYGKAGEDLIKNTFKFREVPEELRHGKDKKDIDVDVAIPYWIAKNYNVVVDVINPYHITEERLRENDINYCLGFDIITKIHWCLLKHRVILYFCNICARMS